MATPALIGVGREQAQVGMRLGSRMAGFESLVQVVDLPSPFDPERLQVEPFERGDARLGELLAVGRDPDRDGGRVHDPQPALLLRRLDAMQSSDIYEVIVGIAREGVGVIWNSTDARELVGVTHRVLVMLGGRIAAELTGSDVTADRIVEAAVLGGTR